MPRVKLLGSLARGLGREISVPALSVGQLLERLAEIGGPALARSLYAELEDEATTPHAPQLNRDLRVLVNGRSIAFLEGSLTQLAVDDAVTLHMSGARGYPGG